MDISKLHINDILKKLCIEKGSDLHLKVGAPIVMRKNTKLNIIFPEIKYISNSNIEELLNPLLSSKIKESLLNDNSVDFAYGIKNMGRFRCNIFFQRGSLRAVIRRIPFDIPDFHSLNLPETILKFTVRQNYGLILFTGATGMGKSTTMASIINYINQTQNRHIITIEDPIEFLISDKHSLITQREVGIDCNNPHQALKEALRQDPDIILFSELRTKQQMKTALQAAETGHLVFSTVHSSEASESISRILSLFPNEEHSMICYNLAGALRGVFSQKLIRIKEPDNSVKYTPIAEVLINNTTVQHAILNNSSTSQIRKIMESSQHPWGMQTFDQSLLELFRSNKITKKEAINYATSPDKIRIITSGISYSSENFNPHNVPKTENIEQTNTVNTKKSVLSTLKGFTNTNTNNNFTDKKAILNVKKT